MTEIDPATASHETSRPHHAERAAEQRREEALRTDRDADTTETGRTREDRRAEAIQDRDLESMRVDDAVAVTASTPQSATGEIPRDREEARALAEETRERILDNPERAAESVRDTAHEPAASRMSRAIDALS